MKILFANFEVPRPDQDSAERRMLAILEVLAEDHEVTVYSTGPEQAGERGAFVRNHLLQRGVREVAAGYWSLRRLLARSRFDLLFAEYWHVAEMMAPPFRRANPGAPVVVDTVDLHFVREESGLKLGRSTAQIVADNRRRELAVYSDADLVVNVTPEDDGILRHILPSIPTVIVPNIVRSQPRSGRSRERLLFFVGNFKHSPNVDGIVWFGRETWPLITQEFPDARLEIAGSDSSDAVRALADIRGIHLLGWVPETAPCLERAAVSIAPLRFGGGMKGKVTEALAHGLPVVMTSFGAQGFGGRSGEHYWVADDASAFARAVIELLRNPTEAHAMGLRGQALVNQLCSPEAVGRVLKHIPADVMARNRKHVFASRFRVQVGAALEMVGSGIARVGRTVMGLEGPRE